jgi:Cft2 family RNA processing exonuclease
MVTPEDLLITAAEVLVAHGPLRDLDGWDACRLAAERPWVVADALDRSPTLRRAVDERLAAGMAASLRWTPGESDAATDFFPAADGNVIDPTAGSLSPADLLPGQESEAAAEGQNLAGTPTVAPDPDAVTSDPGSLAGTSGRRVAALEAEIARLNALVPTRADRSRQNRMKGKLRAAERHAEGLEAARATLDLERESLLGQLAAAKLERDEALGERDQAYRSRVALEARLGDVVARAEYLRRLLPAEGDRLDAALADISDGKPKTRLRRHRDAVATLAAALDAAYPAQASLDTALAEDADTESSDHMDDVVEEAGPAPTSPSAHALPLVRVGPVRAWNVQPLGGAEEIGGSAVLVSVGDRRILVDAGIRPNARSTAEMRPPRIDEVGDHLDAIVVTHAHADHAGYVPALLDRFPTAKIICSPGTEALLPTMWRDSLSVMNNRIDADSEWMLSGPTALYTETHLVAAEENLRSVEFGRVLRIGDMDVSLFPAGHVLGASGVLLAADGGRGGRVIITGDISDQRQASVGECELPDDHLIRGADLLVIESTYCHEAMARREDQVDRFVADIRDVISGRGRVLVPAFALGRAQEIALILAERLPDVPVLIDGLARQISTIYELQGTAESQGQNERRRLRREATVAGLPSPDLAPTEEDARAVRIFRDNIRAVPERGTWREIHSFERGVVITTSGMLAGGPAIRWAKEILPEPRDALFLCGYQDEESPGRRLLALGDEADGTRRQLTLFDNHTGPFTVDVRARVHNYHLSAHADQRGLISVIDRVRPREVMLVHGRRDRQHHFREVLKVRGHRPTRTADWQVGPG